MKRANDTPTIVQVRTIPGITQLLVQWNSGSRPARDQLVTLVYDKLRRLAEWQMRGQPNDHTLQPTALVHEAYLRLAARERLDLRNRQHFFCLAALVMRQILADHANARRRLKRGGGRRPAPLSDTPAPPPQDELCLEHALRKLEASDERRALVFAIRFYLRQSVCDTARTLGISAATVKRDWREAVDMLQRELQREVA